MFYTCFLPTPSTKAAALYWGGWEAIGGPPEPLVVRLLTLFLLLVDLFSQLGLCLEQALNLAIDLVLDTVGSLIGCATVWMVSVAWA